jgi:hypothetical protein
MHVPLLTQGVRSDALSGRGPRGARRPLCPKADMRPQVVISPDTRKNLQPFG